MPGDDGSSPTAPRWHPLVLTERPPLVRYAWAFVLATLALLLTSAIFAVDPSRDFQAVMTAGVVLAAASLGYGPSLLVALVGAIGVEVVLVEPRGSFTPSVPSVLRIVLYLGLAALIASLVSTLRKTLALVEEQRRDADRAARERRTIVNVVSHDLRAPIHALRVQLAVLERAQVRSPDPAIASATRGLKGATDRMQRIVRDLRDVVRIEVGQLALSPREVAVRALVDETLTPLAQVAAERDVALRWSTEGAPATVRADRLDQVLANIVENALRHTPPKGAVDVDVEGGGGRVRFVVSDTGSGIAPADLPHIFEPYWTRAAEGTGTGLGLFIVRRIVEGLGGEVSVASTVGEGTVVCVTLPEVGAPA